MKYILPTMEPRMSLLPSPLPEPLPVTRLGGVSTDGYLVLRTITAAVAVSVTGANGRANSRADGAQVAADGLAAGGGGGAAGDWEGHRGGDKRRSDDGEDGGETHYCCLLV